MPTSSRPLPALRLAGEDEDWEALTALLHRAYGTLAAQGLRFYASHQPVEQTRKRAAQGECWLGELDGRVVSTITLVPPERCAGSDGQARWYDRPEVASSDRWPSSPRCVVAGWAAS